MVFTREQVNKWLIGLSMDENRNVDETPLNESQDQEDAPWRRHKNWSIGYEHVILKM